MGEGLCDQSKGLLRIFRNFRGDGFLCFYQPDGFRQKFLDLTMLAVFSPMAVSRDIVYWTRRWRRNARASVGSPRAPHGV